MYIATQDPSVPRHPKALFSKSKTVKVQWNVTTYSKSALQPTTDGSSYAATPAAILFGAGYYMLL